MSDHNLPPMAIAVLRNCVERGSTRCNDGGMVDDFLSMLCSKPSLADPYVRWTVNPTWRSDGYCSRYEPTDRGRQLIASIDIDGGAQ